MEFLQKAQDQIIKPPRFPYSEICDLPDEITNSLSQEFIKKDLHAESHIEKRYPNQLLNSQIVTPKNNNSTFSNFSDLNLSIYQNPDQQNSKCVLYLHTYSGNKVEGSFLFDFLPANTDLALFDFIGSGNSDDAYATYGLKEKFDIANILRAIESERAYDEYFLWGRSMGAVVAIYFADHFLSNYGRPGEKQKQRFDYKSVYEPRNGKIYQKVEKVEISDEDADPPISTEDEALFSKIKGLILDSPFTNLKIMLQGEFNRRFAQSQNEHSLFRQFSFSQINPQISGNENGLRCPFLRPFSARVKFANSEHVYFGRFG